MKILQVVPVFSPVHGGSSTVPYYLSKELAKRGHEVTIYTSDYIIYWEWVESLPQVNVCPFKTLSSLASFYVTPKMMNRTREEIKSFDVIHLHDYRTFQSIVVSRYAKKFGVPYVLQAHGSLPRIMDKQRLKWIYDVSFGYRLLRDASRVIALSQVEAEQYRSMGVPEERIAIVANGIDLSEFADLPLKGCFKKKFNIPEGKKVILYLGRIHKIKGIDLLVKAYAYMKKKMRLSNALLVIAGTDDGYLIETQALIRSLKIDDQVLLPGPLYGCNKIQAYVDADVYVLPSRYEIWGLTAFEAVACGTPIILTENNGAAEYFRDKVGLVVKPDSNHLAEALYEILLNQDKQKLFRENCEVLIKKFSISKTVSELERVYEEVRERAR